MFCLYIGRENKKEGVRSPQTGVMSGCIPSVLARD